MTNTANVKIDLSFFGDDVVTLYTFGPINSKNYHFGRRTSIFRRLIRFLTQRGIQSRPSSIYSVNIK